MPTERLMTLLQGMMSPFRLKKNEFLYPIGS